MNWLRSVFEQFSGLSGSETVRSRWSFAASWFSSGWLLFACLALIAGSLLFYLRFQSHGSRKARFALGLLRGTILCLLLITLADPIREVTREEHPPPLLWVLVDGSESMNIADALTQEEQQRLATAVGLEEFQKQRETRKQQAAADSAEEAALVEASATADTSPAQPEPEPAPLDGDSDRVPRIDYVRALLAREGKDNLLRQLSSRFRLRGYVFGGSQTGGTGLRPLPLAGDDEAGDFDPEELEQQLTAEGPLTAIGDALTDLAVRHATSSLAGVVLISDFDQNSGRGPVDAARQLGRPVFAVGVGPKSATDLAVDLQAPLKMKKGEQSTVTATLRQQELTGEQVSLRVRAHRAGGPETGESGESIAIGTKTVRLEHATQPVEFPWTPDRTGRFVFTAEVDPLESEIVTGNNIAQREVTIIDDFMRLLFVEHEPTWEWRFIKEVFHRDQLVGTRGFRTFLRSSDPIVREQNELFVNTLTLPRREFFKYDVVFLGDMPAANLRTRFCEMLEEFVGQFGGGLVVLAGPRFGPGQLAQTPLADMLPVILDPDARLRDQQEFRLQRTALASQYDFMQLGKTAEENDKAWDNLGRLPWYQPVRRLEPGSSTVLAEHPVDTCVDGRTKQPLIAIRRYGRGEVVYVGINEMWRLRRKYGEEYYRQFWGQMIHRLGLSHALGSRKRFVVRTDRQQYQADDRVLLTVEAYDENFEPLTEDALPERTLAGELLRPLVAGSTAEPVSQLKLAQLKPGIFEVRVPVFDAGEYRVRVTDPLTEQPVEVHFQVANVSVERRSAVRGSAIQQNVATSTRGRALELDTLAAALEEFNPPRLTETTVRIDPLWTTGLWFGLIVLLMLCEWFFRKWVHLA
ncbi:MAG: hypothetical protein KDA79_07040 [Planctomycetaceae bacterium]|nr:hypothetical protein [Planctomycetaceae bacterium]